MVVVVVVVVVVFILVTPSVLASLLAALGAPLAFRRQRRRARRADGTPVLPLLLHDGVVSLFVRIFVEPFLRKVSVEEAIVVVIVAGELRRVGTAVPSSSDRTHVAVGGVAELVTLSSSVLGQEGT